MERGFWQRVFLVLDAFLESLKPWEDAVGPNPSTFEGD